MFRKFRKLLKCSPVRNVQKRSQATQEVNIFINGKEVKVPAYYTILQALRKYRVTLPSFCYHERLSIAGNCRMCLVHIEGNVKPQIACAMPVAKGMKVRTNHPATQLAQEGVLEFLLVDHPLDCPICDQGGECDLQDLTMRFGNDRSRFTDIYFEGKRAVENKDLGPLIRTEMNRCIHCTRCIRFGSQIAGIDVLGTSGRGHDMLVGTYVDKMFLSEISGNIIDLCPVGSLTSIPYMFKARAWELRRCNSIDVTDATGTNIELNYRFDRVIRVLPRENDEVNQEWVSDKGRWSIDSLEIQRLVTPMTALQSKKTPSDWDSALKMAGNLIGSTDPSKIAALSGPHTNVETLVTAKDYLNKLGSENTYIPRSFKYSLTGGDVRAGYSLNMPMKNIAEADKIVLIGTNPRFEAPILNIWIRQAYTHNDADIYALGPCCEYNYHVNYLGCTMQNLKSVSFALQGAKKPLIFVGLKVLEHDASIPLMAELIRVAAGFNTDSWKVLHVIPREASFTGALEVGWKLGGLDFLTASPPEILISLGADEIFHQWKPPESCKVIYIGFQGDIGAQVASIILPGSAYTESGGTFMNMEGRSQYAMPAVTPPGKARHDWKIIRALSEYGSAILPYSDMKSLEERMAQISPNLIHNNSYQPKIFTHDVTQLEQAAKTTSDAFDIPVDIPTLKEFYCSDVFSSNSLTMIKATKAAREYELSAYAQN